MKRVLSVIIALVVMLSLAAPAFAAEDTFVPSITYKADPEIVTVTDEEGNEALGVIKEQEEIIDYVDEACLIITPVADALDEEKEVYEPAREILVYVYEQLSMDEMELPYDKLGLENENMVIRDLFDVRFNCAEHPEMLNEDGVTFDITFDLGVEPGVEVYTMTFNEETEEWEPIVKTVNNGDGTVTCTFEHLCVVAFSVVGAPAQQQASFPWLWVVILLLAVVVLIVIVLKNRKKKEEKVAK